MRAAWPATRPAHPFLQFRAYPFNVLPSGFRFLDGDYPADPFIARERRNVLPLCPRLRVRDENFAQVRRYAEDILNAFVQRGHTVAEFGQFGY